MERETGHLDLGWARLDTDRVRRTGDPEVVFGGNKDPQHVVTALGELAGAHPERAILATRVSAAGRELAAATFPDAEIDDLAATILVGTPPPPRGNVAVVSAGTSDGVVAAEAAVTLRAFGTTGRAIPDVGVAGLHRVLAVREEIDSADAVIVIAGMDGALPSVVGGLTGRPVVAVPTSVGYGASFGGIAALLTMLNSCAPGVVVVNIDNGFGAAVHAARIARGRPE